MTDYESFKFKSRLSNNTNNDGTVNVEILVPVKYLSNFWKSVKMPQINCEITLDLIWSAICAICEEKSVTISAMTDAKLYISEVTLSI